MSDIISVLIADDHAIVRRGLVALVGGEVDMVVVGEAENGFSAVQKVRQLNPDVLLLDLVMPDKSGLEALREIQQLDSKTRVLILTSYSGNEKVFPSLQAGAAGYVLKDASPQQLLEAIRSVNQGLLYLHPSIAQKVERFKNAGTKTGDPFFESELLTQREVDVLRLVAQGLSNQEIAEALVISNRTVGNHIGNILNKLGLDNRTQATLFALRNGLVDLQENPV